MPPDKAEQIAFGAHHSAPLELAEYWVARGYKHHGPPGLRIAAPASVDCLLDTCRKPRKLRNKVTLQMLSLLFK